MTIRIPGVRFERVAAAFDADVARVRLCESSSGSDHSPPETSSSSSDHHLSYLVKSFMERGEGEGELFAPRAAADTREREDYDDDDDDDGIPYSDFDSAEKKREMLEGLLLLFAGGARDDDREAAAKEKIRKETAEIAAAWKQLVGSKSSSHFKRHVMARLRERGFDAGLCKSKWERNGRFPAGDYEYVDVNFDGKRYIVQVSLASEFEIARPTNLYSSLLDVFPPVFVGKVEELKQVVRLMCNAIKGSMKSTDLLTPPWRRNGYMQAKWFSSYKRTTNDVATKKASPPFSPGDHAFTPKRSIGFEARPVNSFNCRDVYERKTGFRVSHLTEAFL
ncbi:hypothetical protein RIF29_08232 [Crotalaria pallida]|uniref:Uncharacterized protein n=1 Tax=Crotalaria pallida TaxID=3830 RepID=A0AAN9J6B3_CROPI